MAGFVNTQLPQMNGINKQHLLELWRTTYLCLKRC